MAIPAFAYDGLDRLGRVDYLIGVAYDAFKNNDQLKTNTALQMESAKIEFKVI